MNESEAAEILRRLRGIEDGLRDVNRRLHELERKQEGQVDASPARPTPPPIPFDMTPSAPPVTITPTLTFQSARPTPSQPTESEPICPPVRPEPEHLPEPKPTGTNQGIDEVEYKLGMQGLLRGGAAVVVVALIFLVALAISRRWITLEMQFAGEILLCLGFIGVGFWKRDEKEEFGQLLTGIGSCGLYLSFAGAQSFKQIISGEALILAFVAISLLNLWYSYWRTSQSFLVIGLIGGLVASTLPLREGKIALEIGLHALILAPTAWIIYRNKWQGLAIGMWICSLFALMPALLTPTNWELRICALYAAALLSTGLYAAIFEPNETDKVCGFVPISLMFVGLLGSSLDGPLNSESSKLAHGSWHVVVLGALVSGLAYLLRSREVPRNALLLGGTLITIIIGPTGLDPFEASLTYSGLAVLLAAISLRIFPSALCILAWIEMGLGLVAYNSFAGTFPTSAPPPAREAAILLASMAAIISATYSNSRSGSTNEKAFLIGAALIAPFFLRLGFVGIGVAYPGLRGEFPMLFTSFAYAMSLFAIASAKGWKSVLAFGWVFLLVSLGCYIPLLVDSALTPANEMALVVMYALGVLGATKATLSQADASDIEIFIGSSGVILGALLVRLTMVLLSPPTGSVPPDNSLTIGLLLVALIGSLVTRWKAVQAPLLLGWLAHLGACLFTLSLTSPNGGHMPNEVPLLATEVAMTIWLGMGSTKKLSDVGPMVGLCVLLIGVLVSRIGYIVLPTGLGINEDAALTATWIAYATLLIALGFRYRQKNLRYWSLGLFGLTVLKVFMVDVAGLDPAVRVLILFALGITMLGGGYAYIRMKGKLE